MTSLVAGLLTALAGGFFPEGLSAAAIEYPLV